MQTVFPLDMRNYCRTVSTTVSTNTRIFSALLPLLLAACCTLGYAPAAEAQTAAAPAAGEVPLSPARPLSEMLDADGTLRPETGFRGSLDVTGWQMTTAPDGAPVFTAAASPDDEYWQAGFSRPGVSRSGLGIAVHALAVDDSGNLYVAGIFTEAGGVSATQVARWDGTSWSALGSGIPMGLSSRIWALAVDGNGTLYAGGDFTVAGGVSASRIAKWDGTEWSPLGTGMNWAVTALIVDGSGNLYAGGGFSEAGGVSASRIARWDGSSWSAVGSGISGGIVRALAMDGNGNIYAGGRFAQAEGVSTNNIARWDGTSWSALGTGISGHPQAEVRALAFDGSGNLYAGGRFPEAGGATTNNIARWDGTNWSALGSGMNNFFVNALAIDGSGNLYAGGDFTEAGEVSASRIARWDGTEWSALGSGTDGQVVALLVAGSGNLYVGGGSTAGGLKTNGIARWNGTNWSALGNGIEGTVHALAVDGSGNVYAGGTFAWAGGVSANRIARWDGTSWSALETGMNDIVRALAVDGSGNLYAGGDFTEAGGVSANRVARWDGSSWSPLGNGMGGPTWMTPAIHALAVDGSGDLYAGGEFTTAGAVSTDRIARWDGSAWSELGGGMNGVVTALALGDSGNLYAGGNFTTAGGESASRVARWDGTSWSALGSGIGGPHSRIHALAVDGEGNLYVGGFFTAVGGVSAFSTIAVWDGTTWAALEEGTGGEVHALTVDEGGNLYAGGTFSFTIPGGLIVNRVARWDEADWSALGSGIDISVYAVAVDGSGNLYAGGSFFTAGGKASANFALWTDPDVVSTEPPAGLPDRLALEQNYPNPFNPSTTIGFELQAAAYVSLKVYDLLGREVATVVSKQLSAGRHEYVWDAGHLPSGVYLYRLEAGEYREMRRMVLVR